MKGNLTSAQVTLADSTENSKRYIKRKLFNGYTNMGLLISYMTGDDTNPKQIAQKGNPTGWGTGEVSGAYLATLWQVSRLVNNATTVLRQRQFNEFQSISAEKAISFEGYL